MTHPAILEMEATGERPGYRPPPIVEGAVRVELSIEVEVTYRADCETEEDLIDAARDIVAGHIQRTRSQFDPFFGDLEIEGLELVDGPNPVD